MFTNCIQTPALAQDTLGGLSRSLVASKTQRNDKGLVKQCRGMFLASWNCLLG